MTKARDLADLISGGFNAAKIPDLPASKITSGSLADARIANLSASKLTGALPAIDGASLTGIEGTATGTILSWSTSSIPSGFLECDGTAVSRSTYSALFAVVGTTYGTGDGSSTFNLPNLADNVPVGKSNNKSLASTGGANTVTPTGNISGSTANASLSEAQLASHDHFVTTNQAGGGDVINHIQRGANAGGGGRNTSNAGSGSAHSHNMSANFSGSSTSIVQPYLTVIYIIKT
ncbi:tail collar domain-containing protein [uncultured Mediterranean phage uvMED]|nr:tail collar domain-containing protein [uncultured Mediterranean phage uvMED]